MTEHRRAMQCPYRRSTSMPTCGLCDLALGWRAGMPLAWCDRCWDSGPHSAHSIDVRKDFVAATIKGVKAAPHIRAPDVRMAMATIHDTANAAQWEGPIPAPVVPTRRWLFLPWEGEPRPKRMWRFWRSAWKNRVRMFGGSVGCSGGCGCLIPLKRAWTWIITFGGRRAR